MNFQFTSTLPGTFEQKPLIISGPDSLQFHGVEYLLMGNSEEMPRAFEIRYEYHCSPFKEALLVENLLAVGHEEHFYLFDLANETNLLVLKMGGYFGHLYQNDNDFYVASARAIFNVDKKGKIVWKNSSLGIDGVLIESFSDGKIYGSGEWDPPGGWIDFVLDSKSGDLLPRKSS